VTIHAFLT